MIIKHNHEPKQLADGLHTFWGAFQQNRQACADYGARTWNDSTTDQYESIVRSKIIPLLANHDVRPISSYAKEDFLNVIETLRRKGKNKDGEPFEAYEEETLLKYTHIIRTIVAVASYKGCFPDVFSDDSRSHFETTGITPTPSFSHVMKSFSPAQERDVLNYLSSAAPSNGEAIALYLMYALGLRNSEACAARFCDIKPFLEFPGCYYLEVLHTTEVHTNNLKLGGKTYNTSRRIPLHPVMHSILLMFRDERVNMLKSMPMAGNDVHMLPIAFRKGNPLSRCGADDVTAAARRMFSALNLHQVLYSASRQLQQDYAAAMEESSADEFVQLEKEPTAYVFRRNFASNLAILGLHDAEIAYLMGHVIDEEQAARNTFLDERILHRIKKKLDKRIFPGEPHAFPQTLQLQHGSYIELEESSLSFIVPEGAARIQLSVAAKEPNEGITVHISSKEEVRGDVSIRSIPLPEKFGRTVNVMKEYRESHS